MNDVLSPLPPALRNQISESMKQEAEEIDAKNIPKTDKDRAVVEILLQEIFYNIMMPIGYASRIFEFVGKWDRQSFKIGDDGKEWTANEVASLKMMNQEFFELVSELKFDFVEKYFSEHAWKGEPLD